jgi:Uma2 family endonuclease
MAVEIERGRRLFTVDEYDRMAAAGIFKPDERIELIDGEIVEMSPIGDRHAACVINLNRLLVLGVRGRAIVSPQNPVRISAHSKPQPDLALLRARSYISAGATVEDMLLVVEVADTTVRYDRTVKRSLYARAGIPEYWVVDANAESVDVYRTPIADSYRDVQIVPRDGVLTPLGFPDVTIAVAEIFS